MTARLGSEYRYFGKLVLVPFRYFSIDTYRNIDIFDNTSREAVYCRWHQFKNLNYNLHSMCYYCILFYNVIQY